MCKGTEVMVALLLASEGAVKLPSFFIGNDITKQSMISIG